MLDKDQIKIPEFHKKSPLSKNEIVFSNSGLWWKGPMPG